MPRLLLTCIYPSRLELESEVRELCQTAAGAGHTVQAVCFADRGSPRRNAAAWPRQLCETVAGGNGPWLVLDPSYRIAAPLDNALALLDQVDLAVPCRPDLCPTAFFDPGLMLLRRTPATLELLADWAERSEAWAAGHRFGHGATLLEAILASADRLRWRALCPAGTSGTNCLAGVVRPGVSHQPGALDYDHDGPALACQTSPDANYVILAPQGGGDRGPLGCDSAEGTAEDYKEFAARHGVNQVWTLAAPVAPGHRSVLEDTKLSLWKTLSERLPEGSRLVVCDYDTLFLRDPRAWAVALDSAELVVAWDAQQPLAMPRTEVLGLKLTASVEQLLWPALAARYDELRSELGPFEGLAAALGDCLRRLAGQLSIATLPSTVLSSHQIDAERTRILSAVEPARWLPGEPSALTPPRNLGLGQLPLAISELALAQG